MAGKFVLTAEVQLQSPKNLSRVAADINKALSGSAGIDVNVAGSSRTQASLKKVEASTKAASKAAEQGADSFKSLGKSLSEAVTHVARYDVARRVVVAFSQAISNAVKDAIAFERELVKVAQVTGKTIQSLRGLTSEISRLATTFGVSSKALIKTSRILSQTGLTAGETQKALEALAKSTLAPTFDDITSTAETSIAAMAQFGIKAKDLEGLLSRINTVAGNFAVEAGDIGTAIKRTGGAFKSAGGSVEELIALFTSVRSTTRETAETIATGFRTIFTRLQRPTTIKFLKQFGIELQTMEGQFVGPLEAVERLHVALKGIDPKDVRFSQIVEQLGGFRQVSKVIPLIQEFDKTQAALNIQQNAGNSISKDAATAQSTLAVQFTKTKEAFTALIREISQDAQLRGMIELGLKMAEAFLKAVNAIKPLIPLLITLSSIKIGAGIAGFARGRAGRGRGGGIPGVFGFNEGGLVPGQGNRDTVPAMLSPGEFVITKRGVSNVGLGALHGINKYAKGGPVKANQFTREGLTRRIVREKVNLSKPAGAAFEADQQFNPNDSFTLRNFQEKTINASRARKRAGNKKRSIILSSTGEGRKLNKKVFEGSGLFNQVRAVQKDKGGESFENLLLSLGLMGTKLGGNQPFDGKTKSGRFIEARNRKTATGLPEILDKSMRHVLGKGRGRFKIAERLTDADGELSSLPLDVGLISAGTGLVSGTGRSRRPKRKARGGSISGSGTDTVPALLTPGEFVVNRRSAGAFGYNNLANINKYAGGGMVTGGKHRYAGPREGYISPSEVQSVTAKSMAAGGTRTRAAASTAKAITIAQNKLVKELRKLHKEYGDEVVSLDQIEATRRGVEKNLKKQLASSESLISAEKATAGTRKALDKALKKRARAEEKAATTPLRPTPPSLPISRRRGGGGKRAEVDVAGSRFGATALFASTLAGAASSAADTETAFGKLINAVSDAIIIMSTLAFVGKEFGDDFSGLISSVVGGVGGAGIRKFGKDQTTSAMIMGQRTTTTIDVGQQAKAFQAKVGKATQGLAKMAPTILAVTGGAIALGGAMEEAAFSAIEAAVALNRIDPNVGGARALAAGGGGVEGAGAGAGILLALKGLGTKLGPVGIALTILATIIGGATLSVSEFNDKLKKSQFDAAQKEINNSLGKVARGEKQLGDVIDSIRKDLELQKKTGVENTAAVKKATEGIAKALDQDFKRRIKGLRVPEDVLVSSLGEVEDSARLLAKQQEIAGRSVAIFVQEFGGEINKAAKAQGISSIAYIRNLDEMARASAEAAIIQAKLTKALKEQANFLNEARDVGSALSQMNEEIVNTTASIMNLVSGFGKLENRFSQPNVARLSEISKNPEDILDFEAFNQEVKQNADFLRRSGLGNAFVERLEKTTVESAKAIRDLPNVIQTVGAMPTLGKDQFATAVLQGLGIDRSGTVGKELDAKILNILQDPEGQKRFKEEPTKVAKELADGLPEIFAVQQKAAELQNQHNRALQQLYARRIELENTFIDKQKRVLDFEDEISEAVAKRDNRERTLGELTKRRFERARSLLGEQSALGDSRQAAQVDVSVKGLIKRYTGLRKEIEANQELLADTQTADDVIRKKTVDQISQLNRTAAALKELGNISKELAAIQRKSAADTKALDQKRNFLTNVVFSDDEGRRKAATSLAVTKQFTQNLREASQSIKTGADGRLKAGISPFEGILPSRRGNIRQVLKGLQDAPIFQPLDEKALDLLGLSDLTDKDVVRSIEARGGKVEDGRITEAPRATGRDAERLAVAITLMADKVDGLTVAQAKALVQGVSPEVKELKGIKSLMQDQLKVLRFQRDQAKGDVSRFGSVIEQQNNSFLIRLQRILSLAEERRLSRINQEAKTRSKQANAAKDVFKHLPNVIGEAITGKKDTEATVTTDAQGRRRIEVGLGRQIEEEKLATAISNSSAAFSDLAGTMRKLERIRDKGGRNASNFRLTSGGLSKLLKGTLPEGGGESILTSFFGGGSIKGRRVRFGSLVGSETRQEFAASNPNFSAMENVRVTRFGSEEKISSKELLQLKKNQQQLLENLLNVLGIDAGASVATVGAKKIGRGWMGGWQDTSVQRGFLDALKMQTFGTATVGSAGFVQKTGKLQFRGGDLQGGSLVTTGATQEQLKIINNTLVAKINELKKQGAIDSNQAAGFLGKIADLRAGQAKDFGAAKERPGLPKVIELELERYVKLIAAIGAHQNAVIKQEKKDIDDLTTKLKKIPEFKDLTPEQIQRLARVITSAGDGANAQFRKNLILLQGTDLLSSGLKSATTQAELFGNKALDAAGALETLKGKINDLTGERDAADRGLRSLRGGRGFTPIGPVPEEWQGIRRGNDSGASAESIGNSVAIAVGRSQDAVNTAINNLTTTVSNLQNGVDQLALSQNRVAQASNVNTDPIKVEGSHEVKHGEIPVRFINTSQFTEEFIAEPVRKLIATQVAAAFNDFADDNNIARRAASGPAGKIT